MERVTNEKLFEEYQAMIHDNEIEIYAVGDIQAETISAYLKEYFKFEDRETSVDVLL
ncbi:hypothetical protein [Planococcus glaciei]|uniref:hypothetical protein n=1 Tax=Planococcus glaciei TaxID=459472 RepID=UPI003CCD99E1